MHQSHSALTNNCTATESPRHTSTPTQPHNAMASTAVTPLAGVTYDQTHASNIDESPFLKLAPELRNRIYDFTFKAAGPSSPVPHALTRTNRQIRSECRAMYYASIECLEISVRTLAQIKHTQRWLAEEDWSMFPVLPDFTFLTYNISCDLDVTISCCREEVTPAHEFSLKYARVDRRKWDKQRKLRAANMNTYTRCLGFNPREYRLGDEVPESFIEAIRDVDTWITRRLDYEEDDSGAFYMFFRLAVAKQGSDWDEDDIISVVRELRARARYRELRANRS